MVVWISIGTAIVIAVGGMFWVSTRWLEEQKNPEGKKALPWNCTVCGAERRLHPASFNRVAPEEAGMIVQQRPQAYGRSLGEIRCQRCRTTHTFLVDTKPPTWLISDEGRAGHSGIVCTQCRKTLINPPWSRGTRDGEVHLVEDAPDRVGVVCARCGDICCVECVRNASRGRTPDGSYLCPRCYRQPVDRFHHY